jgi:general stress protein 26
MHIDVHDRAAVEHRLWDEIDRHRTGMLSLTGGARHTQPMTAFTERHPHRLWFFAGIESDIVHEAQAGAMAMFLFQVKDLQACLSGRLVVDRDEARVDKFWNAVVAAWYPDGKTDANLTLLRLDLDDGQVWISQAGPARFAWEIAKANATHHAPDLGGRTRLDFH